MAGTSQPSEWLTLVSHARQLVQHACRAANWLEIAGIIGREQHWLAALDQLDGARHELDALEAVLMLRMREYYPEAEAKRRARKERLAVAR